MRSEDSARFRPVVGDLKVEDGGATYRIEDPVTPGVRLYGVHRTALTGGGTTGFMYLDRSYWELAAGCKWVPAPEIICPDCEGTGDNPATRALADTFAEWSDHLDVVEVQALIAAGRLTDLSKHLAREPTPADVAAWAGSTPFGHDSFNKYVCVRTRAKRLGVWGPCSTCGGQGETTLTRQHLLNFDVTRREIIARATCIVRRQCAEWVPWASTNPFVFEDGAVTVTWGFTKTRLTYSELLTVSPDELRELADDLREAKSRQPHLWDHLHG